jgi:hypothetical protein
MRHDQILTTWRTLDAVILSLTEAEVFSLLAYEFEHERRTIFLVRLFGRANKLRARRELKTWLEGAV